MEINKISSHPPSKKQIDEFILGAEQKKKNITDANKQELCEPHPWHNPNVRKDVQKVFTAKLPEEYILKIKYISDKTNKSQQKIVRELLCSEIDKLIHEIE